MRQRPGGAPACLELAQNGRIGLVQLGALGPELERRHQPTDFLAWHSPKSTRTHAYAVRLPWRQTCLTSVHAPDASPHALRRALRRRRTTPASWLTIAAAPARTWAMPWYHSALVCIWCDQSTFCGFDRHRPHPVVVPQVSGGVGRPRVCRFVRVRRRAGREHGRRQRRRMPHRTGRRPGLLAWICRRRWPCHLAAAAGRAPSGAEAARGLGHGDDAPDPTAAWCEAHPARP